jgi:hypothetical protein
MMATRILLVLVLALADCLPVIAGTGSLYSPAGLPQSSSQSYTVPSPQVQGTTVTFPTPPIPLGGALQDFPSSALPVAGTATGSSPLSGTPQGGTPQAGTQSGQVVTTIPFKPPSTETGNIESFFQCGPADVGVPKKKSAAVKVAKSPGKLLWHVLDNLGVPMFVGKDNDLDPSLTRTHFIPPKAAAGQAGSEEISPGIPEKIPESELEGPEVLPNDQSQVSPK